MTDSASKQHLLLLSIHMRRKTETEKIVPPEKEGESPREAAIRKMVYASFGNQDVDDFTQALVEFERAVRKEEAGKS